MFEAVCKNTIVPLMLRLCLAAVFIFHGWQLVGGEGHQWGSAWANSKNPNPPPQAAQLAVSWGELVGGIALALGFLTRLAALGIIVIMAGAIATVHWKNGFDLQKGGYEYNVALITMCLALVLTGGGMLAVDRLFWRRRVPPGAATP